MNETNSGAPVSSTDLVRHQHSQNESVAACSDPHTSPYPVEAYKDGHVTLSGWMLVVEGCPKSQSNFLGVARTPQSADFGKDTLRRWREAGYPNLGAWPPEGVEIWDFALGAICGATLMPNDQAER